MSNLPVICTLTPETLAIRKANLLSRLAARAEAREEIPGGIRLRLPAGALSDVATTVNAERQCCRFLRFEITAEPDLGPIWLSLSGPQGTREFLSAMLE